MNLKNKIDILIFLKRFKIRKFCYIYNSRIDFVDFWLCLYIIATGIVCLYYHPLENIPNVYTNLTGSGMTSNKLGVFSLSIRSYKFNPLIFTI